MYCLAELRIFHSVLFILALSLSENIFSTFNFNGFKIETLFSGYARGIDKQ